MPRKPQEINVIVYYPQTEEGKKELATKVAEVHSDVIISHVNKLSCSKEQKKKLFKKIIDSILNKENNREN